MSWYRQYRPKTLAGLHQQSSRDVLRSLVLRESPAAAFLLVGPKGIGKTSSARIVAKVLNCENNTKAWETGKALKDACGSCPTCLSIDRGGCAAVIELDAASHRGIDDVRSLREQAYLAPADARVKVFILDEVHMLTAEAFNALLKILEEPPAHVRFILATTEAQKVPATIRSRCAVIQYTSATTEEIAEAINQIAEQEGIQVDSEVVTLLARMSDGSFRDAVKQFEQLASGKKELLLSEIEAELFSVEHDQVERLITALFEKDLSVVREILQQESQRGRGLTLLQKETLLGLARRLDRVLLETPDSPDAHQFLALLSFLNTPVDQAIPLPDLPFELNAIRWCLGSSRSDEGRSVSSNSTESKPQPKSQPSVQSKREDSAQNQRSEPESKSESKPDLKSESPQIEKTEPSDPNLSTTSSFWQKLRSQVKAAHPSLEALLAKAVPLSIEKNTLKIGVGYTLHRERLSQDLQRQLVEKFLQESLGRGDLRVSYILIDKSQLLRTQDEAVGGSADSVDSPDTATQAEDAELLDSVHEALLK